MQRYVGILCVMLLGVCEVVLRAYVPECVRVFGVICECVRVCVRVVLCFCVYESIIMYRDDTV